MKPFKLEEHLDWLKFIDGKQEYDTSSVGQYQGLVCPECGSEKIYHHNRGGGDEKSWFECEKCHYMNNGDVKNIPTYEEYINKTRSEKLGDIL
jgi:predicted RNA-binding Zn-ribbon protein involved in translation (DUF1610 family)